MANSFNHFKALLKKNWILFKRSPCGSCSEIVTPIVFVLFLLAVRSLVSKDAVAETSYISQGVIFTKSPNISNQTSAIYDSSDALIQTNLFNSFLSKNIGSHEVVVPAIAAISLSLSVLVFSTIKEIASRCLSEV